MKVFLSVLFINFVYSSDHLFKPHEHMRHFPLGHQNHKPPLDLDALLQEYNMDNTNTKLKTEKAPLKEHTTLWIEDYSNVNKKKEQLKRFSTYTYHLGRFSDNSLVEPQNPEPSFLDILRGIFPCCSGD